MEDPAVDTEELVSRPCSEATACSIGIVTRCSTTAGDAPGYEV